MWSQILSRNPACSHCPARSSPSPARLQVYPGHFRRSLASRIQLPSPFPVAANQHGKAGSGSRGLRSGNPLRGGVLRCCTCNACQCAARKPLHPNHPPRSGPLFQGAGREAACPPSLEGLSPAGLCSRPVALLCTSTAARSEVYCSTPRRVRERRLISSLNPFQRCPMRQEYPATVQTR